MERQGSGDSGRTDRANFRFVKITEPGRDHGAKIAESIFGGAPKLNKVPLPDGDLGDLGDLFSSVITKTKSELERREEKGIYAGAVGAGKGRQGLQGLQSGGVLNSTLGDL
jgi:hypothetical protein